MSVEKCCKYHTRNLPHGIGLRNERLAALCCWALPGAFRTALLDPDIGIILADRPVGAGSASLFSAPHDLHRYRALADIYRIPSRVVQAAPLMASWIKQNVARPVIIEPDKESEQ